MHAKKAIVLAAGQGLRLARGGWRDPKCLLRFGGRTLLARHAEILARHGVEEWVVAVGYRRQLVERELAAIDASLAIRTVVNPDWSRGSNLTLWHARDELCSGAAVLLMDADVLFDARLMRRLQESRYDNCFLLDREYDADGEAVELCIRGGVPAEFRKRARGEFDLRGESVGFFRFSPEVASRVAAGADRIVRADRLDDPYEDAIREVVLSAAPGTLGYEDITGIPWIEIDFPEDVTRAGRDVLPALQ